MKDFSEAANLYAQNEFLVEAIHKAFKQEMLRFLDECTTAARSASSGLEVWTKDADPYRYFWIGQTGVPKNAFPQLWCKYDDGSIVRNKSITFTFMYPNKSNAVVARMLEAVVGALTPFGLEVRSKNAIQFSFTVPFADSPTTEATVASPLAAALLAMDSLKGIPDDE